MPAAASGKPAVRQLVWQLPLALVTGALAALGVLRLRRQLGASGSSVLAFISLLLTLAGWFVNARFSATTQREMFLNNIINAARLDIIEQIRVEQAWARAMALMGSRLRRWGMLLEKKKLGADEEETAWFAEAERARDLLHAQVQSPRGTFMMVLAAYELLFGETRHLRLQLAHRRIGFAETYGPLIDALTSRSQRQSALAGLEDQLLPLSEYGHVLEDLRVHIQNRALGEIIGKTSPPWLPPDTPLARVVTREDGQLHVIDEGRPWPIHERARTKS